MALKIRLRRQGKRNQPFYRLVVADVRSPRDGSCIETVGWYNPMEKDDAKAYVIDAERVQHWLGVGAQLTESAETLVAKGATDVYKEYKAKNEAHRVTLAAKKRAGRKAQK